MEWGQRVRSPLCETSQLCLWFIHKLRALIYEWDGVMEPLGRGGASTVGGSLELNTIPSTLIIEVGPMAPVWVMHIHHHWPVCNVTVFCCWLLLGSGFWSGWWWLHRFFSFSSVMMPEIILYRDCTSQLPCLDRNKCGNRAAEGRHMIWGWRDLVMEMLSPQTRFWSLHKIRLGEIFLSGILRHSSKRAFWRYGTGAVAVSLIWFLHWVELFNPIHTQTLELQVDS